MHERAKKPAAVEQIHTRETAGAREIDGRQGVGVVMGGKLLRRADELGGSLLHASEFFVGG